MEFRGKIKGLAAKETKTGVSYAIAIEAALDEEAAAALMREIGESVRIEVEQPQLRLPLKPPKDQEQMTLDQAVAQGVAQVVAAAIDSVTSMCGEPAVYEISFAIDATGAPAANGEPTSAFRCVEHAQEFWRQMDQQGISYISANCEGRTCEKLVQKTIEPAEAEPAEPIEVASGDQLEAAKVKFTDCKIQDAKQKGGWNLAPLCENCGGPIGEDTASCPHCGAVQSKHLPDDNALVSEPEQPDTSGEDVDLCVCGHADLMHEDGVEPNGVNALGRGACSLCSCPTFRNALISTLSDPAPEANGKGREKWWESPGTVTPTGDGEVKPKKSRKAKAEPTFEL